MSRRKRKSNVPTDMLDRIGQYFQHTNEQRITGSIHVHRALVKFTGDLNVALVLQYCVWCDMNMADDNGEWGQTIEQFQRATMLSRYMAYKALNVLKETGILESQGHFKWGKHPRAVNVWSLNFNLLVMKLADFLKDPENTPSLLNDENGFIDAENDPARDSDAHWFVIPSIDIYRDPNASVLDDENFGKAEKWAAGFKQLNLASGEVIEYSYALFEITGMEPHGFATSAWLAEIERLIKTSRNDLALTRVAFHLAMEKTNDKQFLTRPSAFLRWIRAAQMERNKIAKAEKEIKEGKRPGAEKQLPTDDMYATASFADLLGDTSNE